jgi:WD40 repeat protein
MSRRVTTRILRGHQSEVGVVALTADESRAVSGGKDKRVLEWDLHTPSSPFREYRLDEPARQVVFRPDSRSFYTVDPNGRISLWDWEVTTPRKQLSTSSKLGLNTSILLSPGGELLITGTGKGQLCVLSADTLEITVRRSAPSEHIVPVEFFDADRLLVAVESEKLFPPASDNYISVWDTETWQLQSRTKTDQRVGYIHPREYCAVPPGSNVLLYPSGAELAWWDLKESKELARCRVNSRRSGVIALCPTEPVLASAARGDFVSFWNWQTRRLVRELPGYRSFHSVAFSPDGRRMVTGSHGQGAIMLWDVSTRQEIARFGTSESVVGRVQFSPDGNIICAVDQGHHAYFWRAPSFEEINRLERTRRTN